MTDTIYNCLLRRQYSVDSLKGGEDIQRIVWKLIFETDYARPPGRTESRQKMILDVLNRRVPPLTEEEANLDRRADDLLRRNPLDMRQQSA